LVYLICQLTSCISKTHDKLKAALKTVFGDELAILNAD